MSGARQQVGLELEAWLDEVADVLAEAREVRHRTASDLMSRSSPAALELHALENQFGSDEPGQRIHRFAQGWMVVAGDHMAGIAALCRAREVVFAPSPLVRAVVEYCGRVVWLLDPKIRPDQRLGRALVDELFSAEELCTAASHLGGKGSAPHQSARSALKDLRAEILNWFPDAVVTQGPKDWSIAGERFLSPTAAIEQFGERWGDSRQWVGTYDGLSSHTHPGAAIFEFFAIDDDGDVVATTDREAVEKLVRMAVVPYYQALRHLIAYCKWPTQEFDHWEEQLKGVLSGLIADKS